MRPTSTSAEVSIMVAMSAESIILGGVIVCWILPVLTLVFFMLKP